MIEEKIIEILKDKEATYFELKRELKIDFGSLDYYLLKLKKENKIKSVKKREKHTTPCDKVFILELSFLFMKVDTIFTVSEIATPENKLLKGKEMQNIVVIKDGAVAVDNGKIIDFGKENEIRSKYTGEIISFEGKTMLPGFVDSHTHLVFLELVRMN